MIIKHVAGRKRLIASLMLVVLYIETIIPSYALGAPVVVRGVAKPAITPFIKNNILTPVAARPVPTKVADIGGPTQPESQAFHSVNSDNMVDLFSGDFSYTIPLIDVGGYPLAIGYNSGIGMDQEASWVGLGWNLNPGSIMRNMRGLPDDFNGTDTVQKVTAIKPDKTAGLSAAGSMELIGFPMTDKIGGGINISGSLGVFRNNYKGWGVEAGMGPEINVGGKSMGTLTASLSLSNNSMDGLTIGTGLGYKLQYSDNDGINTGDVSLSTGFNTRTGLKELSLGYGLRASKTVEDNEKSSYGSRGGTILSFAYQSYLPKITLPFTTTSYTYAVKGGVAINAVNLGLKFTGYGSTQEIKPEDQRMTLPAYGYLNYQAAGNNQSVLTDFNREKDMPYREKPHITNIGVPAYTYDVFAISGEGIGGSFRAYRNDVGKIFDHYTRTKSGSRNISADLGTTSFAHAGADLRLIYAYTETGAWSDDNIMSNKTAFSTSNGLYEAAYFRNPAEMTVNDNAYYQNLGGDDVVAVKLSQAGENDPVLLATGTLSKFKNARLTGEQAVSSSRTFNKGNREKRTQVISYFTAEEAGRVGFPKTIESYAENQFEADACPAEISKDVAAGDGLRAEYFNDEILKNKIFERVDAGVNMLDQNAFNLNLPVGITKLGEHFSVHWTGRVKAPVTGKYTFYTQSDDGISLNINGQNMFTRWGTHGNTEDKVTVNLVAGEFYEVDLKYFNWKGKMRATLEWSYPEQERVVIPAEYLYSKERKGSEVTRYVTREKRVNTFRQKNHISEIDVLKPDGKRYVYGIPVYNLKQKEATFSVAQKGNSNTGLVPYTAAESSVDNKSGNDNYFSSELTPAYAHTFLLSAVLSSDYQDLTGDGISSDDRGDAIKFNYTRTAGLTNPYAWRAPMGNFQASYNEGLKTDNRDDKGSYVYGEKELWYLNSVESKNMIAVFRISSRKDLPAVNEQGARVASNAVRKLDRIDLYTKAEFAKGNSAKPLKSVNFEYNYTLCDGVNGTTTDNGKLTLTKVWFTYNGNSKKRSPYVFNYNASNPTYNPKEVDRWGSYKPMSQNPAQVNNNDYPYSIQDSILAAKNVAAWTLDNITLPSGGQMKIDYESDDYAFVQNKRAAQMFTIAGFASSVAGLSDKSNNLYKIGTDYNYIAVKVPKPVKNAAEAYARYLDGMTKIYFRMYVNMPADKFGSGAEYVPCYATLDPGNFGVLPNDNSIIWFKVKAIDTYGQTDLATSIYSPLTKAAISYLRLNLSSKAYPGSETGDDVNVTDMIKILATSADNYINTILTFDVAARTKGWAKTVDLSRSYVRLNNPYFKKYGGGIRVKRIRMYDNWQSMTQQKEAVYGQEYEYTTTRTINGGEETISSGVAIYEPMIGGEENPWRQPLEYLEQVAALAPTAMGYTETPIGEQFFPSPSVGYSKVKVRTINAKNTRSANGFSENCFYTAYDFPTLTDMTVLDQKRFKPSLANFLHIDARHYIAVTQGFKVELNDMHGKLKSQGMYSETDPKKAITFTKNYYRVDDENAEFKHLNSTVMTMDPTGRIVPDAVIGKDMELMMDMRQQHSVTVATNYEINGDLFPFPFPPVMLLPMLLDLYSHEETLYRSAAVSKVIYRHGILDSVVAEDKGSTVVTRNLLYDSETGNPILNSTQNEYGDPIYNFKLPAGWAYDGLSGAYKNIGATLNNIYIRQGKIVRGTALGNENTYFAAGDKIMIDSKPKTGGDDCNPEIATFPAPGVMYAIDANALNGGTPDIYFVDENGQPFTGNDISLKIIKSGRKNMEAVISDITMLENPLVKTGNTYNLVINNNSKVINASSVQLKSNWKVADSRKPDGVMVCVPVFHPVEVDCGIRYGNHRLSGSYYPRCAEGSPLGLIVYVVPENKYTSAISQDDADNKAYADISANGQAYANQVGECSIVYRSDTVKATKAKVCPTGTRGTTYTVTLPAGYATGSSKTIANQNAQNAANDSAQNMANRLGQCLDSVMLYLSAAAFESNIPSSGSIFVTITDANGKSYSVDNNTIRPVTKYPIKIERVNPYTVTVRSTNQGSSADMNASGSYVIHVNGTTWTAENVYFLESDIRVGAGNN